MAERELLLLDLRAPLHYRGMENPPLRGLPSLEEAKALLAGFPGLDSAPGTEGEEELLVFEAEDLLDFDPDEGPRARSPLPALRFYGRNQRLHPSESAENLSLESGRYLFLQVRVEAEAELLETIEWFAREAWWEGKKAQGPYFIRRLREDGATATQILRRAEGA